MNREEALGVAIKTLIGLVEKTRQVADREIEVEIPPEEAVLELTALAAQQAQIVLALKAVSG